LAALTNELVTRFGEAERATPEGVLSWRAGSWSVVLGVDRELGEIALIFQQRPPRATR